VLYKLAHKGRKNYLNFQYKRKGRERKRGAIELMLCIHYYFLSCGGWCALLKGQCHEIFDYRFFFHASVSLIRACGGKFDIGVIDTSGAAP
jgi:hypothetical protein